jgi:hypothetical protein
MNVAALRLALAVAMLAALPAGSRAADTVAFATETSDTLEFSPTLLDSLDRSAGAPDAVHTDELWWVRSPVEERLLADPDEWAWRVRKNSRVHLSMDYNRVDPVRIGLGYRVHRDWDMAPRIGMRIEYATARERVLYAADLEQPLSPQGRVTVGASIARLTDHGDLQQVRDAENTLAMLFGRQDYRDYFEREGFGAFVAARLMRVATVSLHVRNDRYRSLEARLGTPSWFHTHRPLRANPSIADGDAHRVLLRVERSAPRAPEARAGFYHGVEFERAGGGLGGDFDYARLLADARNVSRLSPAMSLALRAVIGSNLHGSLPPQREFTVGGADGLRAHTFAQYRGDQVALLQAEYTVGLWRLRSTGFEGGLHAIAFLDAGRAWLHPEGWNLDDQRLALDGGVGLGTAEDNLRVYFAKNLREPDSDLVISARLRRPF